MRLEEGMADAAMLPVWLPVLALALTVDHACVDAKRFALDLKRETREVSRKTSIVASNSFFCLIFEFKFSPEINNEILKHFHVQVALVVYGIFPTNFQK